VKDTFDTLNLIFDKFITDEELPGIIGITDISDITQCDSRFRRSFADMTVMSFKETDTTVPFIDFSFVPSHSVTANYLVNKETIEFNIYVSNLNQADEIYKAIKRILGRDDYQCTTACQAGCPVQGVLRYRFTAKTLVSS